MKNEQSIIGRHAFHKLLVEAISQATQDEKALRATPTSEKTHSLFLTTQSRLGDVYLTSAALSHRAPMPIKSASRQRLSPNRESTIVQSRKRSSSLPAFSQPTFPSIPNHCNRSGHMLNSLAEIGEPTRS